MNMNGKPESRRILIGVVASAGLLRIIKQVLEDRDDIELQPHPISKSAAHSSGRTFPDLLIVETNDDMLPIHATKVESPQSGKRIPLIAVTTAPDHRWAVKLVRAGVIDYIALPAEQHRLYDVVERFRKEQLSQLEQRNYLDIKARTFDFSNIVGHSPALQNMLSVVQKIVDNEHVTVLVLGETGTGKGLLAKAIHYNSRNRSEPFVEIGCSALPESLLESELFGHERGAFTDARDRKLGLFELAGTGTIFLDEIGDITLAVQSKLLKVLEERTMRRVGGVHSIKVHARIIAATSRNLEELVQKGMFRKDLYYRLHTVPLMMPPLRDRREDIPLLVDHYLKHYGESSGKPEITMSDEARALLYDLPWQGNVRELMHWIERAVVLSEGPEIDVEDFDFSMTSSVVKENPSSPQTVSEVSASSNDGFTLNLPFDQATILETERKLVREVLQRVRGNKSRAASILKISRPRLERIIRLDPDFFKPANPK
jgi:two-component system response regulator AtoC